MKPILLRQILALCLGPFIYSPVLSQEYQFQNFNVLNGLPSSETYHMIQDRHGFVWAASDNGVVRYDGEKFQHYSMQNGLVDNTVFGFFEDSKGRIWFRSYSGALAYFQDGAIYPYRYNTQLKDTLHGGLMNSLVVENDRLWFSTLGSTPAGYVDSKGNFVIMEKPFDGAYLYLYTLENGQSIVGINGRGPIPSVKADGKVFRFPINSVFRKSPVAVQVWRKGTYYFGANTDIFKYDHGRVEWVQNFRDQVISLSVDRQDNIWVGLFNGGVRKYENGDFTVFSTIPELKNNSVTTVLQDSEGGYWFSTLDRGIFYFPNLGIRIRKFTDDLSKLSAVARGKRRAYIGDYNGKVKALGPGLDDSKVIHEEDFPVSALFEDPVGNVWGSCKGNSFVITPEGNLERQWEPMVTMKGFFSGPSGQTCGYYSTGVYALEGPSVSTHIISILGRPQAALSTDSIIYVGTLNGLERYDHKFMRLNEDSLILKYRIASLQILAPGKIAVGTVGEGLFVIENGKALKVNGVPAANIYSLLVKHDRIWAATEKGLLLSSSLSPHNQPTKWKQITRGSGLLSDKCNALAALGNDILVFSDQGISVVPANVAVFSTDHPNVYVKNYEINNVPVGAVQGDLDTDQNNITLNVGAIAFNNRDLFYRHRVNESSGWSYSEGGNISYFALRPGSYKIEIEASTDKETWHKNEKPVVFSIDRPWWATWTFRGVMIVLVFLLGFIIYRLRINAIRRRQTYLELINSHQQRLIDSEIHTQERERKRIAKDLHDGVGTSLSSIKFMVSDSVNTESQERAQRVQEINDVLTDVIIEIQRIVYDLHPPALERYGLQVGLKNLADRINNHGGISIVCDYYGHRDVSSHVSITIYRIIQELINNTLKHAKASEIRIHVNQFDDELNVMYEDNGIGMIGSRFAGLGLRSIESRVTSLQGHMTWESNHKGTFYNFDIPF